VLGEVLLSAIKVLWRELEDAEPEGHGITAQPFERLFSAALKAWKMTAASRLRGAARAGGGSRGGDGRGRAD